MAAFTRLRVSSRTLGCALITRETVPRLTSASCATSRIDGLRSLSSDATSAAAEVRRVILPLDSILILSARPASRCKKNRCVPPLLAQLCESSSQENGTPWGSRRRRPVWSAPVQIQPRGHLGDEDIALALHSFLQLDGNVPNFPCLACFVK